MPSDEPRPFIPSSFLRRPAPPPSPPVSKQDAALAVFQKLERLVVAAALEVMGQARVDWFWQRRLQHIDLFRNCLQARQMFCRIASALFVMNNGEAFP
jgi:hypothetical protein